MSFIKKIRRRIYNVSGNIGNRYGFDLPYFVENGFWVMLSQTISMGASFAVSLIFARYLTKEVYGEYQLIISMIGIFGILSYNGLNVSVLRSVAKGFDYSYVKAVKFSFKKSLLTIPIFTGIAVWYYFRDNNELAIIFVFAAILFSFIYAHNKWLAYWKGKEKFEKVAKQQIIQNVILNSALIIGAIFYSENVFVISLTYLIVNAGFHTFWHYKTKQSIKIQDIDDECIPYGKYLTGLGVLSSLILYFDKIVIGFFDIKLLAVYTIALKLFDVIKQLLKNIFSVSMPKFAKKNIRISNRVLFLLMISGLFSGVVLFFFAEPLIRFLYTNKYDESALLFKKFIFVLPLLFVNPLLASRINAQKIKKRIFNVKIYAPLISMVFSVGVFIISSSPEYFILSKIYSQYLLNFLFLAPWFFKD